MADDTVLTYNDVETQFFGSPVIVQPAGADPTLVICMGTVRAKNSENFATLTTSANKDGECPTDVASYFKKPELNSLAAKSALFDTSKAYNVKSAEGRSRLFRAPPSAFYYPVRNPVTANREFEAFCQTFTYLDPRVHKGDSDLKIILYKRMPTPEKLASLDDQVTCGDINYAYENEIKTRKPIALRDFTVDAVPHKASAKRLNSKDTFISNRSGHKRK